MMGIRADITPQAARIDAHCLNRQGPVRLCYADSVLHTKPRGIMTSRVPIRIGAELYGHSGVECDIELVCLMHETLRRAGIDDLHIVLGHVGIFRSLVAAANLQPATERSLFEAVQRKAFDEIDAVLDASVADPVLQNMLKKLAHLSGDESVIADASQIFADAPESVRKELQDLVAIVEGVKRRIPDITLCFDLCELRGYEYHTGIVFAAYTPAYGRAVAKGGRYDHIGEVFGRARPASGFDSDLKTLAKLTSGEFRRPAAVLAPAGDDKSLLKAVAELRAQGEVVINWLQESAATAEQMQELGCDRKLVKNNDNWEIEAL
jgi:ATP phosphoribosyltransferase regulatory subunit